MVRDVTAQFVSLAHEEAQKAGVKLSAAPRREEPSFLKEAMLLGTVLGQMEAKLEKLEELAKKDGLFDDPTAEFQHLTVLLKADLGRVTQMIGILRSKVEFFGQNETAREYADSIVKVLDMRAGEAAQVFGRALEARQKTIQQRDRMEKELTGANFAMEPKASRRGEAAVATAGAGGALNPLYSDDVALAMDGDEGGGYGDGSSYMEQELLELDPAAAQMRAVEQIRGVLGELGQMFNQFSVLVQRQGEQIQRIDDNVEETVSNVKRAQQELENFAERLSGDRSLIYKMFGTTAAFMVVFVLFFL